MKEKKFKKIAEEVAKLISNQLIEKPTSTMIEEYRAEYDSEVSDKMKKFILNVIKYKENLNISISEEYINIATSDIKKIKKSNSQNIGKYSGSEDNYLEISIDEKGFYLNYGYRKRSRYTDEKIFNELLPLVKQRNKEINSENFNEIWEEVMIESGIMRDNNLDELGI